MSEIERTANLEVTGGHMMYQKRFEFEDNGKLLFVKSFDPSVLTDESKIPSMIDGLDQEARGYLHARQYSYQHIPERITYEDRVLKITGYNPEEWYWEVPKDDPYATDYNQEILATIDELRAIPRLDQKHKSTTNAFFNQGWPKIYDQDNSEKIAKRIEGFASDLHEKSQASAEKLVNIVRDRNLILANLALDAYHTSRDHLGHFDARPSNITWHPKQGVRLVDWSWSSNAGENSDSTMFIIDSQKAEFETRNLPEFSIQFSREYAALYIGYWLARSIEPTPDPTVRFHQIASSAVASSLIFES